MAVDSRILTESYLFKHLGDGQPERAVMDEYVGKQNYSSYLRIVLSLFLYPSFNLDIHPSI